MGEVGYFQNFSKLGDANKLRWVEKIENSVIDLPPIISDGRLARKKVNNHYEEGVLWIDEKCFYFQMAYHPLFKFSKFETNKRQTNVYTAYLIMNISPTKY